MLEIFSDFRDAMQELEDLHMDNGDGELGHVTWDW